MLAEIVVTVKMAEGKTGNDVEISFFQLAFFLCADDKTFPIVDVIDPEIGADHMGIIPLLVEPDTVYVEQGERVPQPSFVHYGKVGKSRICIKKSF